MMDELCMSTERYTGTLKNVQIAAVDLRLLQYLTPKFFRAISLFLFESILLYKQESSLKFSQYEEPFKLYYKMSRRKLESPKKISKQDKKKSSFQLHFPKNAGNEEKSENDVNVSSKLFEDVRSSADDEVSPDVEDYECSRKKKFKPSVQGFLWNTRRKKLSESFVVLQKRILNDNHQRTTLVRLGSFSINRSPSEDTEEGLDFVRDCCSTLYLHFVEDEALKDINPSHFILYFDNPCEQEAAGVFCDVNLSQDEFCVLRLSSKQFVVQFDVSGGDQLSCFVFLAEKAFSTLQWSCDESCSSPSLQIMMRRFAGVDFLEKSEKLPKCRENIEEFYQLLKQRRNSLVFSTRVKKNPQHPDLVPILRDYQRQAVQWMLWRETSPFTCSSTELFIKLTLNDGETVFYNSYGGILLKDQPSSMNPGAPGGILADEMGLGKTVEVLALILLHPKFGYDGWQNDNKENSTLQVSNESEFIVENVCRQLIDEMISIVAANVETEIAFHTKTVEQKKRRKSNELPRKGKKNQEYYPPSSNDQVRLSCFCGGRSNDSADRRAKIRCHSCGTSQHKKCVGWTWKMTDDYLCPHCRVAAAPLESKATLIISPSALCQQWYQEIMKHIRSYALKVYIYQGVHVEGFVQPKTFCECDVVVATYEMLRQELKYVNVPHTNRFRYAKRFVVSPSPITAVKWWRICLDEAQMVESVSSMVTEMCLRLKSTNLWCITGTPIQKSVDDIFAFWMFLGAEPFCVKKWWQTMLTSNYFRGHQKSLIDVVAPVLWRTVKVDVLDQLGIPEQEQKLYWLEFGPVEEHFYRRTREECASNIQHALRQFSDKSQKLDSIDRKLLDQLMRPLLKLRQSCCHPQIVRGKFINFQKNQTTMEEVLENMINKTKLECEDEHRAVVAAYNGLAGLQQLKKNWREAATTYRLVLRLCDEQKVRTDPLPKIHAMQNLFEIVESHRTEIEPTCRDDQLKTECEELKLKYLEKRLSKLIERKADMGESCENVESHLSVIKKNRHEFWFVGVCSTLQRTDSESEVLEHVRNMLHESKGSIGVNLAVNFRDLHGLQMVLCNLYEVVKQARRKLVDALLSWDDKKLADTKFLNDAADCHLRPTARNQIKLCSICVADSLFNEYEEKLFNFEGNEENNVNINVAENGEDKKEAINFIGQLRKGTWKDSPLEQALKAILSFAARRRVTNLELFESSGKEQLKLFDLMKKEFKTLRLFYMSVRDHIAARDELTIATERFRFRTEFETAKESDLNVIEEHQVEFYTMKLTSDRVLADGRLIRKLGQLSYLTNLKSLPIDDNLGNPEECPVCRSALGFRWSLLTCGHTFCCNCVRILSSNVSIRCPVCRQMTNLNNVSYVCARRAITNNEAICRLPVKGSNSTKIEAVVRCLLQIRRQDKRAKCLVFSNWRNVLDILAAALAENGLKFISASNSANASTFHTRLTSFKELEDSNILLLPISCGSSGLNIVEATHVLLIDPLLNPAAEQQALGRVHRIGQTRRTTVHKFLVRATVEEKMHNILGDTSVNQVLSDVESPLTIGDLANLFQT